MSSYAVGGIGKIFKFYFVHRSFVCMNTPMDLSATSTSPRKGVLKGSNSPALEGSLRLKQNRNSIKQCVTWITVNLAVLSILLYDLSFACSMSFSYYECVEYGFVLLICLNILHYITKIIIISLSFEPVLITSQQKSLLGVRDHDSSYTLVTPNNSMNTCSPRNISVNDTSLNSTAKSWFSSSPNESGNASLSSSWIYRTGSPKSFTKTQMSPKQQSCINSKFITENFKVDAITDESSLDEFLRERDMFEKINRVNNQSPQSSNLLSNFWRHPAVKNPKDTLILSKCKYQLSTLSRDKSMSGSPKLEDNKLQTSTSSLEPWTRINIDVVALTQWNENLRKWLSQTILERLTDEIVSLNKTLEKHGLNDIMIGRVGLDRLRKTAHMVPVGHIVPSLRTIIPYLEATPNQEYLVKRIQQLAQGGCMSDFRWNSGASHNGKPWNDSLPTDCAIIMHLLATYLDSQLMPLPNAPDVKPFTGYHYIKCTDTIPPLDESTIFIQQVFEKPPHYRIIVQDKVYEMSKGYNNMFHSILFFLYHINKMGQGMIGRVNLGRAGINMLWIIDQ